MMSKLNIKKGDTVKIIAGVSKGETGKVLKVYPEAMKVAVEGDRVKKDHKHTKPNANSPQGGIVEQDRPIHISNVMLVDGSGNTTRVGRRQEDGKSVRYSKKSGEVIK